MVLSKTKLQFQKKFCYNSYYIIRVLVIDFVVLYNAL